MTHTFMDMEVKEEAKEVFKFTAVPFYVVVDKVPRYCSFLSSHSKWHHIVFRVNISRQAILLK